MIRIDMKDLLKAIELVRKESTGGPITFKLDGVVLKLVTFDRSGKEMIIELSDVQYQMMPKLTKTETF